MQKPVRTPFDEPISIKMLRRRAREGDPMARIGLAFCFDRGIRLTASEVHDLVGGDDAIERVLAANYQEEENA